jgi:hypothetical protein
MDFSVLMLVHDPAVINPPIIWGKLASTFGVIIPMGFLWFAKTFRSKKPLKGLRDHAFILVTAVIALFTLPDNFLFLSELTLTETGGIAHDKGFYTYIITAYYLIYITAAFYHLIKATKSTKNSIVKSQLLHIAFSFISIGILALLTNMILPILGIYHFNGLGPILMLILSFNIFYATTRKRLTDMRLVLKNTFSYIITGIIMGALIFVFVSEISTYAPLRGILVFLTVLSFHPIYKSINYILNLIFFKNSSNYSELFNNTDIRSFENQNFKESARNLLCMFIDSLKLKGGGILMPCENSMQTVYSSSISTSALHNPEVIDWVGKNKKPFVRDEHSYSGTKIKNNKSNALAKDYFAAIYIPVINKGKLQAIIVLEDKINHTSFKKQEIREIELVLEKLTFLFVSANRYSKIKDEITDAKKLKKHFKQGLFHEVNTPLTIANNYIEMAKWSQESEENIGPLIKAQDYLKKSSKAISKALELNDIISGDIKFEFKKEKVLNIINSIVNNPQIQQKAAEKELTIIIKNKKALSKEVMADRNYLQSAFTSLLSSILGQAERFGEIIIEGKSKKENLAIILSPHNLSLTDAYLSGSKNKINRIEAVNNKIEDQNFNFLFSKSIFERLNGGLSTNKTKSKSNIEITLPFSY